MNIGRNIKELREKKEITQSELADLLGVSDKTVSSWEINRTEPKMGMVHRIADALNCRVSEVIGEDSEYKKDDSINEFFVRNPDYAVLVELITHINRSDLLFVREFLERMIK